MSDEYTPHDYAMEAAFFADQERKAGNEQKATPLFEQALQWELQALAVAEKSEGLWRAILHRSAGWLALDCNQPRLAEKLACAALAGDPDPALADQLREVLAAAHKRMEIAAIAAPEKERAAEPGEVAAG